MNPSSAEIRSGIAEYNVAGWEFPPVLVRLLEIYVNRLLYPGVAKIPVHNRSEEFAGEEIALKDLVIRRKLA